MMESNFQNIFKSNLSPQRKTARACSEKCVHYYDTVEIPNDTLEDYREFPKIIGADIDK